MEFQFNGENLEIPDRIAVKILTNADLADGLDSFARDYSQALDKRMKENLESVGGENVVKTHSLIVLTIREAARRLRNLDSEEDLESLATSLIETAFGFLPSDTPESKLDDVPDSENKKENDGN